MSISDTAAVFDKGLLVSIPPLQEIFTIGNHHEAYGIWKKKGFKDKILIHIDAHIDFSWINDNEPTGILGSHTFHELELFLKNKNFCNIAEKDNTELINIANYVYPAIKEGIIKEFYWIVPDYIWDNIKQRRWLEKIFLRLKKLNPARVGKIKVYKDRIETEVLGVKTAALKLSALWPIKENVLLDIDVDYLFPQFLNEPAPYFKKEKIFPWIWPEKLAGILKEKQINPSLTTIAYSVEQGFTPLEYKFLGDELKSLLQGNRLSDGYLILQKAIELCRKGKLSEAAAELKKSIDSPSIAYKSARLYLLSLILKQEILLSELVSLRAKRSNLIFERLLRSLRFAQSPRNDTILGSQKHSSESNDYCDSGTSNQIDKDTETLMYLKEAVSLDSTYKTIYNNQALRLKAECKFEEAIRECMQLLKVFPEDSSYRLLLAEIFFGAGKFKEALTEFMKVIETQGSNAQALAYAGQIYFLNKNYDLALEFLNKAVLFNDKDARTNYWLGMVYAKTFETRKAVKYLQKSVVLGLAGPDVYFILSKLYFKQRNFYKAREKFFLWLKAILRGK